MMQRSMIQFLLLVVGVTAFAPSTHLLSPPTRTRTTTSSNNFLIQQPTDVESFTLNAMLQQVELPEKLYIPKEKEIPKVLGGLKIGLRKLVVITGASSGLGLNTAITLAKSGRYFVVMACRDVEKGKRGTLKIVSAGCCMLQSHL
jgi:protochlorophyllide reductase